jgi:hypothetical protein
MALPDCSMPPPTSESVGATTPDTPSARPHDPTRALFALLLAFRLANALTLRTFFQPDEYFQSLEPAWRLAFGQSSNAWITWVIILLPTTTIIVIIALILPRPQNVLRATSAIRLTLNRSGPASCARPCTLRYSLPPTVWPHTSQTSVP